MTHFAAISLQVGLLEIVYFDTTLVRHDNAMISPTVRPYFLKESLGLWYLVGMDKNNVLKTYGVDRISHLQQLDNEFKREKNFDPEKLFKDSFGIWDDPDTPVEEIELVYSELDGKFLKNNPLHSSQTILRDIPEEFRIRLNLKITNDFVMALLSRSSSLTVIKPESLRTQIKDIYNPNKSQTLIELRQKCVKIAQASPEDNQFGQPS